MTEDLHQVDYEMMQCTFLGGWNKEGSASEAELARGLFMKIMKRRKQWRTVVRCGRDLLNVTGSWCGGQADSVSRDHCSCIHMSASVSESRSRHIEGEIVACIWDRRTTSPVERLRLQDSLLLSSLQRTSNKSICIGHENGKGKGKGKVLAIIWKN